jgi:hypothetical protein
MSFMGGFGMKYAFAGRFALVVGLVGQSWAPLAAQQPPQRSQELYVYYVDRPGGPVGDSGVPAAVLELHDRTTGYSGVYSRCGAANAQIAPFLVPLVLFGVNLFARVVERELSAREARRLESLSRTYARARSQPAFPALDASIRCLVVERVTKVVSDAGTSYELGATFVMGMSRVGNTGFTIEPVAARVDASDIIAREHPPELNAAVSVTFQSVVTNAEGANEMVTLPAYSVNFKNLVLATNSHSSSGRSPVMPIPVSRSAGTNTDGTSPTSVVVAVTEAHASLDRVKQQIALDQANRAALVAAIGETVKSALTD